MAGNRKGSNNLALGFVLGAVVVVLAVAGYMAVRESQKDVIRIDVPGFSGEIVTDKKPNGSVNIEGRIGRD